MTSYWASYPKLQSQIESVQKLMTSRIQIGHPDIEQSLIQFSTAGGKYLRPAFFFLFADLSPHKATLDSEQLTKIAASIEFLHMATLVHDDIIDDSPLRRGQVTIQSYFGKDLAVYTGDLLFTLFFELLLETMQGTPYLTLNAQSMKRILMGELTQMQLYFNQGQSIDDYFRAISGKTAHLFQFACEEGAYFGGCSDALIKISGDIGYNIGMAFQILDDILDYTADRSLFNKPVLEDLACGIYTLPLLLALTSHRSDFEDILNKRHHITTEEIHHVAELVITHQGVAQARQIAENFTKKAIASISQLPDSPTKSHLSELTHLLLTRHL